MDDDLLTLLHTSKIFSSLPNRVLKKLLPKFRKLELAQDEILYYQGDPSDSIEVVLDGRLVAILTTAAGENKVIGYMERGETVGEIGSLSGEHRTATVKATKDSTIFKLPSEIFLELCHQYPAVLFEIIKPIASRSQQVIQLLSSEKFKRHVAIIGANEEVALERFSKKITPLVNDSTTIVFLSDFDDEMKNTTHEKIQSIIDDARAKNTKKIKQKIVYLLKGCETPLAKFAFKKIEMFYIMGSDIVPTSLSSAVFDKMKEFTAVTKYLPDLILLHTEKKHLPRDTASWLKLAEFGLHHHIRINNSNDYRRLLRFIRGKAVGLVLSGGGTRGWAHVGAIKALLEAGIPIDAIGGTSVGAIVAASYAITETYEGSLAQFREVIDKSRNSVSWRSLTWPSISIFNGKSLTNILQKMFSKTQTEDLWLPYFCVSTNLAKNTEAIHRHGSLWEQIRCSISIPGVIPPMLLDSELHFDGGLLNNLPVDVMRKITGHRGTVVAIELIGNLQDEHQYNFPPILTFRQTLLSKMGVGISYKYPRFIDTFLKSLLVGSSLKAQLNGAAANILVSLDLARLPMLHSNKRVENKIIDEGYESTMHQIKNMKQKSKV